LRKYAAMLQNLHLHLFRDIQFCPFCKQTREYLDKNKIEYHEINVNEDSEAWQHIFSIVKVDVVPILELGNKVLAAKPGIGISEKEINSFLD
jgi:glutaredoxin